MEDESGAEAGSGEFVDIWSGERQPVAIDQLGVMGVELLATLPPTIHLLMHICYGRLYNKQISCLLPNFE